MSVTIKCDCCEIECGGFGNVWRHGVGGKHITLCKPCGVVADRAVTEAVAALRTKPLSLFQRLVFRLITVLQ